MRARRVGRWREATGLGAVTVALAAAPGGAVAGERADFEFELAGRAPDAPSALTLHLRYKAAGDPDAKPSPIRHVQLDFPAGTRFELGAVPACTASDADLQARAAEACPPASRIGGGTLVAITGAGAPADPFEADATVFNAPGGFVELVTDRGSGRTLGFDRAQVDGARATFAPPVTPGGPPDGETAVRQIDLRFDVPAYVRTPPACPADALWRGSGTFTFADGITVTEPAATPCAAPVPALDPRPVRLRVRPRRVPAGRRAIVRVRLTGPAACTGGARVRVGRRRVRTGAHGRARVTVRLRRGRHLVLVRKPGCPPLRGAVFAR